MLYKTDTHKGRTSKFDVDLTRSIRSSKRRLSQASQAHSSVPAAGTTPLLARFHKGRKSQAGINEGGLDVDPLFIVI